MQRWKAVFEGKPQRGPVGEYDAEIALLIHYGLKPADCERMDPDLVLELLARASAQALVEEARRKKEELERKRELARRR